MERTLIGVLASLSLIGCGTREPELNERFSGDSELKGLAVRYLQDCQMAKAGCHIYNLSIDWSDSLPDMTIGLCETRFTKGRLTQKISIATSLRETEQLYQVVAHEMSHCTRFQDHTPDDELHLMRPTILSTEEMGGKSTDWYVQESFEINIKMQGYETY